MHPGDARDRRSLLCYTRRTQGTIGRAQLTTSSFSAGCYLTAERLCTTMRGLRRYENMRSTKNGFSCTRETPQPRQGPTANFQDWLGMKNWLWVGGSSRSPGFRNCLLAIVLLNWYWNPTFSFYWVQVAACFVSRNLCLELVVRFQ